MTTVEASALEEISMRVVLSVKATANTPFVVSLVQ